MHERFQLRDRALPVVAGVLLALGLPPAPVSAQVQGKEQQLCINELNKNFGKVAKAQGKDNDACIKDGSKGKLGGMSIEECMTADRRGQPGPPAPWTTPLRKRLTSAPRNVVGWH